MADSDEESESTVFEITDFTTASEWERFVSRIEEIIHKWKLDNSSKKPSFVQRVRNFSSFSNKQSRQGNLKPIPKSCSEADTQQPTKFLTTKPAYTAPSVRRFYHPSGSDHGEPQEILPYSSYFLFIGRYPTTYQVFNRWTVVLEYRQTYLEVKEQGWETQKETLHFSDFCFDLTHHCMTSKEKTNNANNGFEDGLPPAVFEMFDMDYDFPPRVHCLSRWYGLKEFLVLSPSVENAAITSEARCHLLLSSVSVALANTKCFVPLLVQLHHKWRRLYFGVCLGSGFRTSFDMAHLRHIPKQFNHLKGLLDVFRDKLVLRGGSCSPVTITVRFTYFLNEWSNSVWPQAPPDMDSCLGGEVGLTDMSSLPFGTTQDAVSELHLSATWPCLSEDVIVDNGIYSDLDPLQAPQWHVRVRMPDDARCLLDEYMNHFMKLCHRKESTSLLRNDAFYDESAAVRHANVVRATSKAKLYPLADAPKDFAHAFQKITKPVLPSNLSTVVTRATSKITGVSDDESPVPAELLEAVLKYLFPDAELDADAIAVEQEKTLNFKGKTTQDNSNDRFRGLKGSPKDSLTYALAICLCIVNHSYGGLRAVAHLWREFVLEMRYRWEKGFVIPRLNVESPMHDCCLIHQKLQMLNCCIARKCASKRSSMKTETSENNKHLQSATACPERPLGGHSNPERSSAGNDSSDDEFFEALEDQDDSDDEDLSEPVVTDNIIDGSRNEADNRTSCTDWSVRKREGALKRCGDLRLLVTGEPVYIPVTQEPAPMTEDMLQEHADILTQLGTTEEGARIRAQMQSASLFSDMAAFKSANPGCLLEDFVRWYSPNDWLHGKETEEEIEYREKMDMEKLKQQEDKENEESEHGNWDVGNEEITEEELNEAGEKTSVELVDEPEKDSTKEWCEEGRLSLRMRVQGNIWEEVWHSAKPCPVRRQKRLFDETKEAEKVFHYFASLRPSEVAAGLLPVLLQAGIRRVEETGGDDVVHVSAVINRIIKKASRIFDSVPEQLSLYKELFQEIRRVELTIARAQSLSFKLYNTEMNEDKPKGDIDREAFIASLLEKPEVNVVGASRGPMGHVIRNLFARQEVVRTEEDDYDNYKVKESSPRHLPPFPKAAGREFILRATVNRPGKNSRVCPQRMYCVLAGDEFRLAGAFTSDTTFT